ncbi:MAG: NUDIX domain-containing protein [Alphaproteobacteria bacterium]|nr:NUDIX domain-containing protein [Alphaproteobacteria bacterium]
MIEYVDIIDNTGKIIGTMSKEEAYKNNCALQVSGVLVFRSSGLLILQRRCKNKKYPLCYDYSAAGHVLSGETFIKAAQRELKEELNISDTKLINIGSICAYNINNPQKLRKLHQVFYTINDGPIKIYKQELDGFDEFTEQQLDKLINEHPEQFTPTFIKVYKEIIQPQSLFTVNFCDCNK